MPNHSRPTAYPGWPATPDLASLPVRVDRRTAAELLARYFFPCSPRTLETWPVGWRIVNGHAIAETAELFSITRAKLDAAPVIRGGGKRNAI
jgi:hypothetical protein